MSNLLSAGFGRILVDLYWSPEQRRWGLCPVSVPPTSDTTTLQHLGIYSCTDGLDLSILSDVLKSFFEDNNSDISVHVTYMIFNLHIAADTSDPDGPVSNVDESHLPTDAESLHSVATSQLGDCIYTPSRLDSDRSNLDKSWFKVPPKYRPVTEYFTITQDDDGNTISPDGWPCSMYIQYASQQRLLLGIASVDSQLGGYDIGRDSDVIFGPGNLTSSVEGSSGSDNWRSECAIHQHGASGVAQANTSFAEWTTVPYSDTSNNTQALGALAHLVQNSTRCGISPILNGSLLDVTADNDLNLYWNISRSAMWSWAIEEPRGSNLPENSETLSCALMDTTLGGYWRAENCSEPRIAACMVGDKPFTWTLSEKRVSFSDAAHACPDGSIFAVPRTGLENTYLYNAVLSRPRDTINSSSVNGSQHEVWLNYNCRNVRSCWVSGDLSVSCPYETNSRELERRTVQAAAVSAIVICVIAALTVFVKCNSSRRKSRRRKRMIEGWDYEGVPS